MKWYSGCKTIFEERLLDFFLQDRIKDMIFLGNSAQIVEASSVQMNWHYTVLHKHSAIEITIVLEGECILEYNGEFYKLQQNDIAVTEKGIHHRERCIDSCTSYLNAYLAIEENNMRLFVTSYSKSDGFYCMPASPRLAFKKPLLINAIEDELNCNDVNKKLYLYSYLKTLYLYTHKNIMSGNSDIEVDYESDLFINISKFIEENAHRNIGCKEICSHFNMSESYLCNFIRRNFGTTPSQFINDIKVRKALNLLLKTDKRIMDIAYEVGYNDQYYFSKMFKDIIKANPSKIRRDNLYFVDRY